MKKMLSIAVICLLPFCSFANKENVINLNSNSLEIQQTSSWEYLGEIQGVSEQYSGSITVKLYVRIIGEREFYQVRYNNTTGPQISAVTHGNFFCKGKKYNAKFIANIMGFDTSYYFNL